MRRAGLLDVLGRAGRKNVQGEEQQKLDVLANEAIKNAVGGSGRVCVLASEEEEEPIIPPADVNPGKYVLLFDPLDGSSNIDVNVSIGTIFSIHRRVSPGGPGTLRDLLQRGRDQVAAGYVIYGSSTVLVYSSGQGVHGFTLDPSIGEFLLWNADIRTPPMGRYYSVNESHWTRWSEGYRRAVSILKGLDGKGRGKNARYIGSLVADFHRNLLAGGVFLYPGDSAAPRGKLRLLYEAAPLAMIAEQAGGAASDGVRPILDIEPEELHQRTPLVIGSREDVALVERVLEEESEQAERL
ncbi:Fructose-1,6-bisphosphatase class 1 [bacterium HR33]|nr:Fructose-1,6-bisphosphatase class 1 [bacterium HR33]